MSATANLHSARTALAASVRHGYRTQHAMQINTCPTPVRQLEQRSAEAIALQSIRHYAETSFTTGYVPLTHSSPIVGRKVTRKASLTSSHSEQLLMMSLHSSNSHSSKISSNSSGLTDSITIPDADVDSHTKRPTKLPHTIVALFVALLLIGALTFNYHINAHTPPPPPAFAVTRTFRNNYSSDILAQSSAEAATPAAFNRLRQLQVDAPSKLTPVQQHVIHQQEQQATADAKLMEQLERNAEARQQAIQLQLQQLRQQHAEKLLQESRLNALKRKIPDWQAQPIDVVYSWCNGSDPQLQSQLQSELHAIVHSSHSPLGKNVATGNRFRSEQDELLYSLRSVEQFLPFYRTLYIVTNGQIPSWLNVSNPRVVIVPHSTIFKDKTHLPTFSSLAIEANLHNIPGLSELFVYMNDDFYLRRQHTINDFVTTEGAAVVQLWWEFLACRGEATCKAGSTFEAQLQRSDRMFSQQYGHHSAKRKAIAHAPYMLQRSLLTAMAQQSWLAEDMATTSSHKFRMITDINTVWAMNYMLMEDPELNHAFVQADDSELLFLSIADSMTGTIEQKLLSVWSEKLHPKAKAICMNDDLSDRALANKPAVLAVDTAVRNTLQKHYPLPSQYELSDNGRNTCTWLSSQYGELPSQQSIKIACGSQQVLVQAAIAVQ